MSLGQERLSDDLLAGSDSVNRLAGGVQWLQQVGDGLGDDKQLRLPYTYFFDDSDNGLGL